MRDLTAKEVNMLNILDELRETEEMKLELLEKIRDARGGKVAREIAVDIELNSEMAETTQDLIEHLERMPGNEDVYHALRAINRDRARNQLFLLKAREIAAKSGSPLTLSERARLNNEIKQMNNELVLKNMATMNATANARILQKKRIGEEKLDRLKRRKTAERVKILTGTE